MSNFFVDSSALGKRYLAEVGSAWVLSWIRKSSGNVVIVCDLAPIEIFSAFARLQGEKLLLPTNAAILQKALLIDMEMEYISVALDAPSLIQARSLVSKYPLRTLDAIQLACAQSATTNLGEPLVVVSGDNRLLSAAGAEGFVTDNPYLHP